MRLEFLVTFSIKQFLALLVVSFAVFSLLFFSLSSVSFENSVLNMETGKTISFEESFYFSLCTITGSCSTNYSALGVSRLLVTLEVLVGLVLFGMFLSKLVGARNAKMVEKVYEGQFKQKIRDYRNSWANYRGYFTKLSKKVLNSKNNEDVLSEISQHVKNKTSENYLKILSSKMNSCFLFLENNYMVAFLDKKFDEEVFGSLLHSLKVTLIQINRAITRLNRSKIDWLNHYSKENLKNIAVQAEKITSLVEKRLAINVSKQAISDMKLIRKNCKHVQKNIL